MSAEAVIEYALTDLPTVVQRILTAYPTARVFTLSGELGAGKTTLVSEFCRQLGIEDEASSPTFSIANEYHGNGRVVYHLDCYRLEDVEEAIAIGFEDYLERGDLCFIEWPAVIEPLLPSDVVHLHLSHPPLGPPPLAGRVGATRTLSLTTPAT